MHFGGYNFIKGLSYFCLYMDIKNHNLWFLILIKRKIKKEIFDKDYQYYMFLRKIIILYLH